MLDVEYSFSSSTYVQEVENLCPYWREAFESVIDQWVLVL